ncbi:MAG: hypothetical protein MHM6MM_005345 [Cercozoa sp. M6MM]
MHDYEDVSCDSEGSVVEVRVPSASPLLNNIRDGRLGLALMVDGREIDVLPVADSELMRKHEARLKAKAKYGEAEGYRYVSEGAGGYAKTEVARQLPPLRLERRRSRSREHETPRDTVGALIREHERRVRDARSPRSRQRAEELLAADLMRHLDERDARDPSVDVDSYARYYSRSRYSSGSPSPRRGRSPRAKGARRRKRPGWRERLFGFRGRRHRSHEEKRGRSRSKYREEERHRRRSYSPSPSMSPSKLRRRSKSVLRERERIRASTSVGSRTRSRERRRRKTRERSRSRRSREEGRVARASVASSFEKHERLVASIDDRGRWRPRTDIFRYRDRYEVVFNIPGVRHRDVSVHADEKRRILTVHGKSVAHWHLGKKKLRGLMSPHPSPLREERRIGAFHREFRAPRDALVEHAHSWMHDGILVVTLKRRH